MPLYQVYERTKNGAVPSHPGQVVSIGGANAFCGYYDVTPFSQFSSKLLAHVTTAGRRTLRPSDLAAVGYFDYKSATPRFHQVDQTSAWCWQMGARLQWFAGSKGEVALYNCTLDSGDSYGSRLYDLAQGSVVAELPFPIYSVHPRGTEALFVNFDRLQRMRPGYGYVQFNDTTCGRHAPDDDGIWLGDFETSSTSLLVSLDELSKYAPEESMVGAEHYVNHLSYSPSGAYFMFLHLWVRDGRRYGRLLTMNRHDSSINLIKTGGLVSHYAWRSENELLMFTTVPGRKEGRYLLFDTTTAEYSIIADDILKRDGHPTFWGDEQTLVTDTTTDKNGLQQLLIYDLKAEALRHIGRFYHPLRFSGEVRCDLHPRPHPAENIICVDDIYRGRRCIRLVEV